MLANATIGASTISYVGYDLPLALDRLVATGYSYVELAAVESGLHHLTQQDMTPQRAKVVLRELETRGLGTNAISAHSQLTKPDAVERFGARLRFAADIGAPVCVTSAGPKSEIAALRRNLPLLLKDAETLGVVIALETNADIVTTARDGLAIVGEFASPWLGLNYDPANVYRATNGRVDPVEDFARVARTVKHLHLKDIATSEQGWVFCGPGGIIDMAALLSHLVDRDTPLGINLELPFRLRLPVLDGPIEIRPNLPALDEIDAELMRIREWTHRHVRRTAAASAG
jgi:sugar phosphate isomerase/epimerase